MTKEIRYTQRCERALSSLFRIAEAAAEHPGEGIEELRHLVACSDQGSVVPIDPSTPLRLLKKPHPLAACRAEGALVGSWTTEGWTYETVNTRWESTADGRLEWWTAREVFEPLEADEDNAGLSLGAEWFRRDFTPHCDPSMSSEDRERIAKVLETAGDYNPENPQPRGCAWCQTLNRETWHSISTIQGDRLANTKPLRWEPVALSAIVRERGLRIDPKLLLARFGVLPNGKRPSILPSSHCA